jgi:hypothetical protein
MFWMVALSVLVSAYKGLPRPGELGLVTAAALVGAGLVIALFPAGTTIHRAGPGVS